MDLSKTWICLALCVAMVGSEVFYRESGKDVIMDCGNADHNKPLEWKHNDDLLVRVRKIQSYGSSDLGKKAKLIESKLRVPSLVMHDSGTYKCFGTDKRNYKVTVEHTLYVMSVSASPSQTVLHSTELSLTCDISPESKAEVRWMKPPDDKPYESPSKTIRINSATETEAGNWTCQIKHNEKVEKLVKNIVVLGPLTSPKKEVTVKAGSSADLTCSLPAPSHPYIDKEEWSFAHPNSPEFSTLQAGPKWNGKNTSKVTFNTEKLGNDFTVTLKNVKSTDMGRYICSVTFKDGQIVQTDVMLKVEGTIGSAPVPRGPGPIHMLGVNMWIWVGAAAALLFLIGLVVAVVLIHHRNKRMKRKIRKQKSLRQGLTARNYCQCGRTNRQPHPGKRERPPPLPRHQYDIMD